MIFARLATALIVAFAALPASAQTPEEFYRGKTMTLVTGTAGAGTYDLVARVVARHLPRFMPGAPGAVTQSMPGASHVRATEYIENVAPRDGLTLGFVRPYVVLNKLLNPASRYHPEKLTWISRLTPLRQLGFAWRNAGVSSVADVVKRQISIAAAGATGPAATVPWALNRMIGTKFRVVRGYADDTAEFIALERGEIEGMGSCNFAAISAHPDWTREGMVFPLYAISLKRMPQYPDTPTIVELVERPVDRAVMEILATMPAIGFTIIAPPAVPADRVEALRRAVDAMAKDPAFVADMAKLEMDVDPLSGAEVAALVARSLDVAPDVVKTLIEDTSPPD
jgi:tripartite-type tricarboxylate transporter receptor subunit TctC